MKVNVILQSNYGEYEAFTEEGILIPVGEDIELDIKEYDYFLAQTTNVSGISARSWHIEVLGVKEEDGERIEREAKESADVITSKLELFNIVLSEVQAMIPGVSADTKAIVASNIFLKL